MRRLFVLWGPVGLYMFLIFIGSAQLDVPTMPGRISDKQLHAVEYAGLSLLTCRAMAGGILSGVSPAAAVGGWGLAVTYGLSDEVHQAFVPGRESDPLDLAADATGAGIAAMGLWAWGIIARSRRERRDVLPPA
jgi:VanZ family protein